MIFLIWYLIGFILSIIGEALFDQEITVRGLIQALVLGILGPVLLVVIFIYSNHIPEIVIWKKKTR